MALDERQQQIKEGAGLEESRLNVEFIEWLRKWSTPLLVVVAVVVLAYVGYQRWERAQRAEAGRAFAQLDSISNSINPSPQSLRAVAEEFEGIRAVHHIARLTAADVYLHAARRGVRPGGTLDPDGNPAAPEDLLTDEQRAAMLADAEALYTQVLSAAPDAKLAMGAAYGLAAIAECRGDPAIAASFYKRVVDLAQAAGLKAHVDIATRRMAALPDLQMPKLYASADLPKLPWADELRPPPGVPFVPGDEAQEPSPIDPDAPPAAPVPDVAAPAIDPLALPATGQPETPKADPPPPPPPP